jgi:ribose transport system substrate-binding protein
VRKAKTLSFALAVTAVAATAAGCGSGSAGGGASSGASAASGGKTVAYINPGLDDPYWQWVQYGVQEAARQRGYKVVSYDTHHDPQQQASDAQTAIQAQQVSGIVLSPNSSTNAPNVLSAAVAAKVPVSIAAVGTSAGTYASFTTSADLQQGRQVGQYMKQILGGKGDVVCLCLDLTRSNAQLKMQGIEQGLAGSQIKIVQTEQAKEYTIQEGEQDMANLLSAHPEIKGVFSMFDDFTLGAVRALQTAGKVPGQDVQIVGMDGSPQTIKMIQNGEIAGIAVQEAVQQGVSAMNQLANAIEGKPVTKLVQLPEPLVTKANFSQMSSLVVGKVYPPGVTG